MFESSGTNNQDFFLAHPSSATKFSSASSTFAVHRATSPDEISRSLSKQPVGTGLAPIRSKLHIKSN